MWHLPLLMAHPDGAVPSGRNVAALTMRSCFPVTGTFTWVMEKNGGGGFGGSASAGVNMSAEDFFWPLAGTMMVALMGVVTSTVSF
jgi:hypothetical protein